jgi:acetylornithine deacetylase ArgE
MILDPVETLKQLVAIPSVNPMGRESAAPTFGEARLTDYLETTFAQIGLTTHRQPTAPGRDNLIARLDGDIPPARGGCVLLFDAHQDTVPVDGMTIEPFGAQERNGRVYGRGACDTKGGMAAILAAVSRLAHEKPRHRPTIIVSCTVNEEYGFTGVRRLVESWRNGGEGFIPRKPDAAVVAEPTGLDVVVAHKGVIRWNCKSRGRAAHSSCPEAGDNAIYRMARALPAIEQYAAGLTACTLHPLCGAATLSVGTIHGGVSVNTVPDRCTIEIDYRLPPGEDPNVARQRLINHLAQAAGTDIPLEHDLPVLTVPSLSNGCNGSLADLLSATVREVTGGCRQVGVPYATDAAIVSAAGVPAVVFGPGFIEQAHTTDEWIPLDQLHRATEILYRFCLVSQPKLPDSNLGMP